MALRERNKLRARQGRQSDQSRPTDWKIPRGDDIKEVTRDATDQVIKTYKEALRELKDH